MAQDVYHNRNPWTVGRRGRGRDSSSTSGHGGEGHCDVPESHCVGSGRRQRDQRPEQTDGWIEVHHQRWRADPLPDDSERFGHRPSNRLVPGGVIGCGRVCRRQPGGRQGALQILEWRSAGVVGRYALGGQRLVEAADPVWVVGVERLHHPHRPVGRPPQGGLPILQPLGAIAQQQAVAAPLHLQAPLGCDLDQPPRCQPRPRARRVHEQVHAHDHASFARTSNATVRAGA